MTSAIINERLDELFQYYRRPFIADSTDDHAMFDIFEQQIVRLVQGSINGRHTTNVIDPHFAKLVKYLMTGSTPFCLYYDYIIIYSRGRLWIYAKQWKVVHFIQVPILTFTSVPVLSERFAPYFNTKEIMRHKLMVVPATGTIIIMQGCNIVIMRQVDELALSRERSQLYQLPPEYYVVSASAAGPRANFIIVNQMTKKSFYGMAYWTRAGIMRFEWCELPDGKYTVESARLYRVDNEFEEVHWYRPGNDPEDDSDEYEFKAVPIDMIIIR